MDKDKIIKLLRSENNDDVQLGYEYLHKECNGSIENMNILLEETNLRVVDTSMLQGFEGPWLNIHTANRGDKIKFLRNI